MQTCVNPNVYANFGRNEQLGWMSQGAPECLFSQEDVYLAKIKSLQLDNPSLSRDNIKWLYHWCGAFECTRAYNEDDKRKKNNIFNSRFQFLQKVWEENSFRPFDTIESSISYLQSSGDRFVVRLSTTKPGFITITTKVGNKFIHTRYQILENSTLIDERGNQHESISSLSATLVRRL